MSVGLTQLAFRNKRSLLWVILALASTLSSAYCFFGWMSVVGRISGWIGLPQYEPQIPRLETQARLWSALAIALPFVAALLLTFGQTGPDKQPSAGAPTSVTCRAESATEKKLAPVLRYLGYLVISLLGTLGFMFVLLLLGLLFHKLGVSSG